MMAQTLLDRAIAWVSPRLALDRRRARKALDALAYYEGAGRTRRSKHWRRHTTDANAAFRGQLADLRAISRDLARNNSHAARGIEAIANNVVGTGIVPKIEGRNATETKRLAEIVKAHAETREIDVEGRHDLYGLEKLVMRTVALSGECLVRRRPAFARDGLALPFQLQVLEPDYIDSLKDGPASDGNIVVQGVEFNRAGQRVAYWLFDEHPGNAIRGTVSSRRVLADSIIHLFRVDRPGQVRGVPWLAPCILCLQDLADYRNAQLMRQKIAACYSVFVTNTDVDDPAVGDKSGENPQLQETLEPGTIQYVPPGRDVKFTEPPSVGDYGIVIGQSLREVAVGLGITYECLTGDLAGVNFSSGRMGWLEMARNIDVWRWSMLIPGFCDGYGAWFLQATQIAYGIGQGARWTWTPPRREMIDPNTEIPALIRAIRGGLTSRSQVIREYGFDPLALYDEMERDNKEVDARGLMLDSDPRYVSAAGLTQARPAGTGFLETDEKPVGGRESGEPPQRQQGDPATWLRPVAG